jgi:hypothetical protein
VERFRQLKESGELRAPEDVARVVTQVLFDTTPAQFSAREWDIGDFT